MVANLLLTTVEDNHRHYAYWVDSSRGVTSIKNNHQHQLQLNSFPQLDQNNQPVIDPTTQQPVMLFQVIALPVQQGEHQHLVTSVFSYKKKIEKKKEDAYYIEKVKKNADKSKTYDDMFFTDNAKEAEKFRVLDQWNKDILAEMEDDQAALTIGLLNAQCDVVCGYQQQNFTDPKVIPIEGGDARTADIYDQLIKHILESNKYHFKKSEAFDDQLCIGRGFLDLKIDRSRDYRGEFKIDKFEWDDARLGPHNEKDGSDAKHGEKFKWISLDELKELYPDKADKLGEDFYGVSSGMTTGSFDIEPGRFDEGSTHPVTISKDVYRAGTNEVLVTESQWKEYRRIPVAFNMLDGLYQELIDISKADLDEIMTIEGIEKVEVVHEDIRVVAICGNTVLYTDVSELDEISIYPFYGKKYKEKFFGKFYEGLDMQKEVNFSHSYAVDSLNTSLKGATFYDESTFPDTEEEERFHEEGTKRGYTGKVTDISRRPVKDRGEDYPQGRVQLEQLSAEKLQQVTNINNAMLGIQNSANESNMLMLGRQKQALLGLQYLFTHQTMTEHRIVKALVRNIPKIYTPDRILRILDNRHMRNKFENIKGKNYSDYTKEELTQILANTDASQYDIEITESLASPTRKQYRFAIWKEIYAQSGGKYPIEWLIKISDDITDTEKNEFFAMLSQQTQATNEAEVTKIKTQGEYNLAQERMKQNANVPQVSEGNMGSNVQPPQG